MDRLRRPNNAGKDERDDATLVTEARIAQGVERALEEINAIAQVAQEE